MMKKNVYIAPSVVVVDSYLHLLTQISVAMGGNTSETSGVTRQRGVLSRETDDYWDDFDDEDY